MAAVRKVICMMKDKLNLSIRCSLFNQRRTVLRGWLTELTDRCRHRDSKESFGEFSMEPRRQKCRFVCQEGSTEYLTPKIESLVYVL
jgi:hypothetical protein